MTGKIVMVTGANSGMGLATTVELAKQGAHVVMVCRSRERGELALEQARKQSGSKELALMTCDLGSLASIRSFTAAFKQKYDRLDVLINNAGVVSLKRELTSDGFESQIGINHLGHFLLTNELLELIKAAPQGRIVNLSSGAHKAGRIHFDDPNLTKGYNVVKGYAQSKLANILFTKELATRLAGTRVTVNSVHPGAVATNIGVDRKTGFGKTVHKLLRPFFRTPLEGARTAIYLASSDEAADQTGQYYIDSKIVQTASKGSNAELAARLWAWSEQQVGLT
ncbi:SDR family oxidoreductase [Paenibacillus sp. FJAT-27812]|uniref:SDR family oxidoreductase n=1 Tax=Paenibacillus sp. FJAT-27812 TaxID=1684143 RepID=UPI0006A77C79|nr:SDR family oxidoreductase [Paenibacillus sp. FJAT-27812]